MAKNTEKTDHDLELKVHYHPTRWTLERRKRGETFYEDEFNDTDKAEFYRKLDEYKRQLEAEGVKYIVKDYYAKSA